jgi:CRISPR type III-A-associated protein Csm2
MEDEVQTEATTAAPEPAAPSREVSAATEAPPAPAAQDAPAATEAPAAKEARPPQQDRPRGEGRPPREDRPKGDRSAREGGQQAQGQGRGPRPEGQNRPGGERRPEGGRGEERGRGEGRGGERREGGPHRGGGDRRPFENPEIELEKLISDSLYLDNQAHAVVARMRDMDSGTKSQLRRLYNAVRRAVGAPEIERQHQFVMLRARLAYTIARHSLRSLDALERLLLQVTRRNDARGYERFKDLFEAIVAYNE